MSTLEGTDVVPAAGAGRSEDGYGDGIAVPRARGARGDGVVGGDVRLHGVEAGSGRTGTRPEARGGGDGAGEDPTRGTGVPELPEEAWWVALAGLPGMGPARLRALHECMGAEEAWQAVVEGREHRLGAEPVDDDARPDRSSSSEVHPRGRPGPARPDRRAASVALARALGPGAAELVGRWARAAAQVDVLQRWRAHGHLGVAVLGRSGYPPRFVGDVEPPVVIFSAGDREALAGPTVAIVGTRRCTRSGVEVATELGLACARAGVRVVSGLAVGIDAAAHRGALAAGPGAAPPVGVVGTGLDVVYPSRSRELWGRVAEAGVMLSEHPLGTEPARWRFPARNRLVAALADVVVVVESPRTGGSMYTVDEALRRGRSIMAVPGPLRSAASAGTNWLLSQGATVVADPDDVITAVGVSPVPEPVASVLDPRPSPTADGRRVLRALGWTPAHLETLAERTGLGLGPLALALDRLELDGWIDRRAGGIERRGRP